MEALVEACVKERVAHADLKLVFSTVKRVCLFEKRGLFVLKCRGLGTFLVVQWLRICLPMQGTQVRSLVQKPTSPFLQGN